MSSSDDAFGPARAAHLESCVPRFLEARRRRLGLAHHPRVVSCADIDPASRCGLPAPVLASTYSFTAWGPRRSGGPLESFVVAGLPLEAAGNFERRSLQPLLTAFVEAHLLHRATVSVNGYFPSLGIKQVQRYMGGHPGLLSACETRGAGPCADPEPDLRGSFGLQGQLPPRAGAGRVYPRCV